MNGKEHGRGSARERDRAARLAAELRANLTKRKAQARARAVDPKPAGNPPPADEGGAAE